MRGEGVSTPHIHRTRWEPFSLYLFVCFRKVHNQLFNCYIEEIRVNHIRLILKNKRDKYFPIIFLIS